MLDFWSFILFNLNCHFFKVEDFLSSCGFCIPKMHVVLKFLFSFPSYSIRLDKLKETFKSPVFLFLKTQSKQQPGLTAHSSVWSPPSFLKAHPTVPPLFSMTEHCSISTILSFLQPVSLSVLILRKLHLPKCQVEEIRKWNVCLLNDRCFCCSMF